MPPSTRHTCSASACYTENTQSLNRRMESLPAPRKRGRGLKRLPIAVQEEKLTQRRREQNQRARARNKFSAQYRHREKADAAFLTRAQEMMAGSQTLWYSLPKEDQTWHLYMKMRFENLLPRFQQPMEGTHVKYPDKSQGSHRNHGGGDRDLVPNSDQRKVE